MAESEELKSVLMKVKEESEKVGLKLQIQKTNIMASSPITSWQIDGKTVETVADFIFFGSKITAPPHHTHRHLTFLAPHERLPELPVVPREKTHNCAPTRENPQDAPVIAS